MPAATAPLDAGGVRVVLASITGQMWVATGSASLIAQSSVNYLAGLVFVMDLMELLLREERARADVERLAVELRPYDSQAEVQPANAAASRARSTTPWGTT